MFVFSHYSGLQYRLWICYGPLNHDCDEMERLNVCPLITENSIDMKLKHGNGTFCLLMLLLHLSGKFSFSSWTTCEMSVHAPKVDV